MMGAVYVLFSLAFAFLCSIQYGCGNDAQVTKQYTVNLDDEPEDRWNHVIKDYAAVVPDLNEALLHFIPHDLVGVAESIGAALDEYISQPYAAEMKGISTKFNISVGEVVLLNIAYDCTAYCTSIVAQAENGTIYHGRNLDYRLAAMLRNITITVDFQSKGQTVYMGTTFVGYVGLLTGQRPNSFTVSLDQRDKGAWWMNLFAAIAEDGRFSGFLIRDTLSQDGITFSTAVSKLAHTHVIAPSYIIVGGVGPDEGAVITRGRANALDVWYLNGSDNRWFLVETNYDHWTSPPPNDDRRDPAESAMIKVGRANISPDELFQVLSTHPMLNNGTTYTTVMSASHPDIYQSWIRRP